MMMTKNADQSTTNFLCPSCLSRPSWRTPESSHHLRQHRDDTFQQLEAALVSLRGDQISCDPNVGSL